MEYDDLDFEGLRAEVGSHRHFHVELLGQCHLTSVRMLGSHIPVQLKRAALFP